MAEYRTPEWYKEQINESETQKKILVHALCDVSRQQFVDYLLMEDTTDLLVYQRLVSKDLDEQEFLDKIKTI